MENFNSSFRKIMSYSCLWLFELARLIWILECVLFLLSLLSEFLPNTFICQYRAIAISSVGYGISLRSLSPTAKISSMWTLTCLTSSAVKSLQSHHLPAPEICECCQAVRHILGNKLDYAFVWCISIGNLQVLYLKSLNGLKPIH